MTSRQATLSFWVALFFWVFAAFFCARADETISSGVTLVIPSQGSTGWGTTFRESFARPLSSHDHTGGGKGLVLGTNALSNNAVTEAKIRLSNNAYLRARNAANTADIDILKVNAANAIEFASTIGVGSGGTGITTTPTNGQIPIGNGTNYTAGTITGTVNQITVTNGAGTITLSAPLLAKAGNNSDITQLTGLTQGSFSPTVTSNPGTISAVVCDDCRYQQLGKVIHFSASTTFTVTGSPTEIRITPPIAGTANASTVRYPAYAELGGGGFIDTAYWRLDATNGLVVKTTLSSGVWTAGAGRRVHVQGNYVIP